MRLLTLLCLLSLPLPLTAWAQGRDADVRVTISTGPTGGQEIAADLSNLQNALANAAKAQGFWNACGERLAINLQKIEGLGDTARITATYDYARIQCTNVPEVQCKGFTCTEATRRVQQTVFEMRAPVSFIVTPQIGQTGLGFTVTTNLSPDDAARKGDFLGASDRVTASSRNLARDAKEQFDRAADRINTRADLNAWARALPNAKFSTRPNGTLGLDLKSIR